MSFAKGKHAYGICDRTGFRYPLKDLRNQIKNQKRTGLLVGKDVLDKDQPQLQLGRLRLNDPEALSIASFSEPADFGSSSAYVVKEKVGATSANK